MKYLAKISILMSLFVICLLTSCNTDQEGPIYTGSGLSFSASTLGSFSVPASDPTVSVDLYRSDVSVELSGSLNMAVKVGNETFTECTISDYHFATGEGKTTVVVTLVGLEVGEQASFSVSIPEEMVSVGGIQETTFNASLDYTWAAYGKGTWTDGLIETLFSVSPGTQWEVEVEKAEGFEVYRMVNPFGLGVCPFVESEAELTKVPCYIQIDCTDPQAVFVSTQSMGIDWGYGEFVMGSVYGNLSNDLSTYPLGTMSGKHIDLGVVFVAMGADYGPYPAAKCTLDLH